MVDEKRQKLKDIFNAALDQKTENRQQFINEKCGGDEMMETEINSLIASSENFTSFMQDMAIAEVADVFHEKEQNLEGKVFGHYKIIRRIGGGGMGEVYLANDPKLDRLVALKILSEKFSQHEINRSRFIQEAKAASSLNHPNILVIHEINEENKIHYIVSEYIEGQTLREIIAASCLNLNDIAAISIQIAGALAAAHEAHLVHRDIKPENIIIRPDGIVKVLDFGLAKLTQPMDNILDINDESAKRNETAKGIILGTVNYMSPEQAKGEKVDITSDIFSLGLVIYEMIAGKTPFVGTSISETWANLINSKPVPLNRYVPNLPDEIQKIISRMLSKNKAERYQSAKDLLVDLRAFKKLLQFEPESKWRLFPINSTNINTKIFASHTKNEFLIVPPHNLTENLSPIIGRDDEIDQIKKLLQQKEVRLLTLTGIGGVGKTRLAQAVAREMLEEFSDGVFFIEFAPIRTIELVLNTIAKTLEVKESGVKPILEVLKDFLKDKQILIIVDNFEQLIEAAPQIAELLSVVNKLKILITSRMLLHLTTEREFIVPPLTVPTNNLFNGFLPQSAGNPNLVNELLDFEAVKLFVERAQLTKPDFVLTKQNAPSVAEICLRLEGLPLAIELAAARVKVLSPQNILSRLESCLKLLTGGSRDLPARQQTMRGAVEWSFDLLSDEEKVLFRRLAVFFGGFTLEAAESIIRDLKQKVRVYSPPRARQPVNEKAAEKKNKTSRSFYHQPQIDNFDVLDGISSLVDKSMVISKEKLNGEIRFRMLEIVREFAMESLRENREAETVFDSHAEYFLTLAEESESYLTGAKAVEWLNLLEEESDNLRAALTWTFERDAEKAARFTAAIQYFWFLHGHLAEGQRYSEAALEQNPKNLSVKWKLLNTAGQMARYRGAYQKAQEFYEKSLTVANETQDKRKIALSNWGIGANAFLLNDHPVAREFLEKSLIIGRELGDEKVIAVGVSALGELARTEGDYAKALPLYKEALTLSELAGNKEGVTVNLNNLGAVAFFQEDFKAAHSFYVEALKTALELGHSICISWSLDGFAALATAAGDLEKAAKLAGAAEALRQSIGFELETTDRLLRENYLSKLSSGMEDEAFYLATQLGERLKIEEILTLINN